MKTKIVAGCLVALCVVGCELITDFDRTKISEDLTDASNDVVTASDAPAEVDLDASPDAPFDTGPDSPDDAGPDTAVEDAGVDADGGM